jgi:hypothetical protein
VTKDDELEAVARALCLIEGIDPDFKIDKPGRTPEPAWRNYRDDYGHCHDAFCETPTSPLNPNTPPRTAEPPRQLKRWLVSASMLLVWRGGLVAIALYGLWRH